MGSIPSDDEFVMIFYPREPDYSIIRCPEEPAYVFQVPERIYTFPNYTIVYHRYPQLIKMSADEQEVQSEYTPSLAAKIPHLVHSQLTNDFLPTAKGVGHAGINLLKAYKSLNEAMTIYCDATHRLIKSADTAGNKAKLEVKELSKTFKKFVEGVNAHQTVISEFEVLANKIHEYSNKDKEKLKYEYSDYKKQEKKLQKSKAPGSENELQTFYKASAADWSRQQELRYRCFNQKMHSWLSSYAELAKLMNDEVPTSEGLISTVINPAPKADDETHNWHEQLHQEATTKVVTVPAVAVPQPHPQVEIQHVEEESRISSTSESSVASTLDELPTAQTESNGVGISLVSKQKRASITIFDNTDSVNNLNRLQNNNTSGVQAQVVNSRQAMVPQQKYVSPITSPYSGSSPVLTRHSNHVTEYTQVVSADNISQQVAPIPAPRNEDFHYTPIHRHSIISRRSAISTHVPEVPRVVPPVQTRSGRTIPGAVPVFPLVGAVPRAQQPAPPTHTRYNSQQTSPYQVVTSDRIPVGRVLENPTEEQLNAKKYHVDSTYVASAAPSHQPQKHAARASDEETDVTVPSYFSPSQYGSILIVNDDFNASSGEQMTVNRGDKVILLKCGHRGWVFVRDSVSNRTGWVPEPYVEL